MKKAVLAFVCAVLAMPAQAQPQPQGPTIADFLTRVQALIASRQTGEGAAGMQQVREELAVAGRELRARQAAERQAGTPPTLCVPEQASAQTDLITHLMALPEAQRGQPLVEGLASYARAKYPCPRG